MNDPEHAYPSRHRPHDLPVRCRSARWMAAAGAFVLLAGCGVNPPDSLGLDARRLAPCPDEPHCVCSESTEINSGIDPLAFSGDPSAAWERAAEAVRAMGGSIVTQRDDYLHATFTTRLLRFVDDLELRLDADARVIHVRSSSRIGYYDFNVNRRRVERLRDAFAA